MKNTINLLAFTSAPLGFWDRFYMWALTVGRYIIIITELVVLVCFFYKFKVDNDLSAAKQNYSVDLQAAKQNHAELETIKEYQSKISNQASIMASQQALAPVLSHTLSLIPSNIFVTTLDITDTDTMEVDGQLSGTTSTQFNQVQSLANTFKGDSTYTKVVLSNIIANSTTQDTTFVLDMNIAK